jgi:toxin ParE1/3/4
MNLSVSFRHSARAEFIEAAAWYESERQNLGVEFIAEIERCVTAAAERPMTYSAVYKDVRRVVAKRFPFSVYFRRKHAVSSFWPFSMAAETPRFGSTGLNERRR